MLQHDRPAVLVSVDDHHDFRVSGWQLDRLAQPDGIRSDLSEIVRLPLTHQIEADER